MRFAAKGPALVSTHKPEFRTRIGAVVGQRAICSTFAGHTRPRPTPRAVPVVKHRALLAHSPRGTVQTVTDTTTHGRALLSIERVPVLAGRAGSGVLVAGRAAGRAGVAGNDCLVEVVVRGACRTIESTAARHTVQHATIAITPAEVVARCATASGHG